MNYVFDFTKVRPGGKPLSRAAVKRFVDVFDFVHQKSTSSIRRSAIINWRNEMSLPELPPLFGGHKMPYSNKVEDEPLTILKSLCEYPSLYVNTHFRKEEGKDLYVVTMSNAEPIISEDRVLIWQKKDITVDLFYDPSLTVDSLDSNTLASMMHWIKIFCSVLTFRGHEVFLDNKIFQPFE